MKKRWFGFLLAAVTTASMAFGAAGAEASVDEIMANYREASKNVKEVSASVDMDADVQLSAEGQTIVAVTGNAKMNVACTLDPLAVETTASMSGNMQAFGGQEESGSFDMTMYMLPDEEGTIVTYVGMDMGQGLEWMKQALDEATSKQLMDMIAQAGTAEMPDIPVAFTLADTHTDVNGTECYCLNATLTVEDILNVLTTVMEQYKDQIPAEVAGQIPDAETLQMVGSMLSGLKFNIEMDIATESYLPMHLHIDMEGSDWVTLSAIVAAALSEGAGEGEELPSMSIDVNSLYMDYVYDYSNPVEIVVPDYVIANAQDAGDLSEYSEMLETLESEF